MTTINAEHAEHAEQPKGSASSEGSALNVVSRKPRAAISWSGGKDSCAALMRSRDGFDVVAMVTMFDEEALRSRSHGLRPEVLTAQANRLNLRRVTGRCTWQTYDRAFSEAL